MSQLRDDRLADGDATLRRERRQQLGLRGLEPPEHGQAVAHVRVRVVAGGSGDRLGGLEEREHTLDVLGAARVVEDAEAQRRPAVHARRRDEAHAALLERGDEAVREPFVVVAGLRPAAEADDAERERRRQLELLTRLDAVAGELREVETAVDRGAERIEPERAQRKPQLERARRPRQLQAEIGEVHLTKRGVRVAEVVGADLECVSQRPARRGRAGSRTRTAGTAICAGRA